MNTINAFPWGSRQLATTGAFENTCFTLNRTLKSISARFLREQEGKEGRKKKYEKKKERKNRSLFVKEKRQSGRSSRAATFFFFFFFLKVTWSLNASIANLQSLPDEISTKKIAIKKIASLVIARLWSLIDWGAVASSALEAVDFGAASAFEIIFHAPIAFKTNAGTTWCKLTRRLGFTHEFCIKSNLIFKISSSEGKYG